MRSKILQTSNIEVSRNSFVPGAGIRSGHAFIKGLQKSRVHLARFDCMALGDVHAASVLTESQPASTADNLSCPYWGSGRHLYCNPCELVGSPADHNPMAYTARKKPGNNSKALIATKPQGGLAEQTRTRPQKHTMRRSRQGGLAEQTRNRSTKNTL